MESLRYLPYLGPNGYLVTSTNAFVNIPNYPPLEEVLARIEAFPRHLAVDADGLAKEAGSMRAANVVMLGAASPFLMVSFDMLEKGIVALFERKGEDVVATNLKALRLGREQSRHLDQ